MRNEDFYALFMFRHAIPYGSFTRLSSTLAPAIPEGIKTMLDAVFLIVTTLLFVALGAYAYVCDKL